MPKLPNPEIKNHFPDCVAIKLHFENVDEPKRSLISRFIFPRTKSKPNINLSLSLVFNDEQEIDIPAAQSLGLFGKAKFGIREGKLSLSFRECKILLETISLGEAFNIYLDVEQTQERGRGSTIQAETRKTAISVTAQGTDKKTVKSKSQLYQVSTSGFEYSHSWKFEVKDDTPSLRGKLAKEHLGEIECRNQQCSISAHFTTNPESVVLSAGQLGLTKNITRNKLALIERAIAIRYIAVSLQPIMSEVEWNG